MVGEAAIYEALNGRNLQKTFMLPSLFIYDIRCTIIIICISIIIQGKDENNEF